MGHPGTALLIGAGAVAVVHAAPALAITPVGDRLFPVHKRLPVSHAVGLTFDDGPDRCLDRFLRELDRHDARATFFLVGEQVHAAPSRAKEIVAAGHDVGIHAFRHRHHLRLTPMQVVDDMCRAHETIAEAIGRPVRLYRPPYGVFSLGSWLESGRRGWERVLWNRWGREWAAGATPATIAAHIGQPRAGDILLLHDSDRYGTPGSWMKTLDALPIILERVAAAGLVARSIGELLDASAPESGEP